MTEAAGSLPGPGGFRFDPGATASADLAPLVAALQIGHDQGVNGGALDEQLHHAMGFVEAVHTRAGSVKRLVDLGSGGGYPGLVLAYFLPETEVILVEVREKRADLLRRAVLSLDLGARVAVFAGEATDWVRSQRESADVVTARSFASPGVTAECGAPALAPQGTLIVSEPPTGFSAARWPEEGMTILGLSAPTEVRLTPATFMVATKIGPTPERYPRTRRQMDRTPLF